MPSHATERTACLMANAKDRVADVKPYVTRAIQDEELRENLRSAFETARDVYAELIGKRGVTGVATKVASDKDIQDQLRSAIDDLRSAANRIQGNEAHKARNSTLLLAGIALGILFNPMTGPETRRWLKNKIFGEEEEFGYGGGASSGNGS
jgi:gas vesicle protein